MKHVFFVAVWQCAACTAHLTDFAAKAAQVCLALEGHISTRKIMHIFTLYRERERHTRVYIDICGAFLMEKTDTNSGRKKN